ncbi:MAG: hypothetical protein KI785_11090 [Devosiaceae bacterium]|nr:hypothetical protein [Devosiaceae bacterium MH13]
MRSVGKLATVMVALGLMVGPALAQSGDLFAAIAFSTSTTAVGYAYDAPT